MEAAYETLYRIVLAVIGILLLGCLYRVIRGPRTADRLIGVNMSGTLTMISVCVLAYVMKEGYLTDVALIYAMLSLLAVVLLSKLVIGAAREKRRKEANHG